MRDNKGGIGGVYFALWQHYCRYTQPLAESSRANAVVVGELCTGLESVWI